VNLNGSANDFTCQFINIHIFHHKSDKGRLIYFFIAVNSTAMENINYLCDLSVSSKAGGG
jgi:hypothetical protein